LGLTVLHIIGSLRVAGIQRFVLDLSVQQVRSGDSAVVVVLNGEPDPDFAAAMTGAGVELVCLHKKGNRDVGAMVRLLQVVRAHVPDVVHTHGYTLTYGLPVATSLGVPVVHTLHALMEVEVPVGAERFYDAAIALGVRFVAISIAVAASFSERFSSFAAVVDSGVDLAAFAEPVDRSEVRHTLGVGPDAILAVTVSRIEHVKGVDIAFDAFKTVAPAHPEAHWLVVGDGAELPALRHQVAASAMADRVHLVGMVTDVAPLLIASDLFLLTSRSEGLGLSVIEGLAAGLPCVVPPVGGLVEIVHHGRNGLMSQDTSVAAIAEQLDRMLGSKALRQELGAQSQASVERFAVSQAAQLYRAVYIHPRRSVVRRGFWRILP
jgi:glycosyltransferase involved in cell wall biosynthesis